MERGKSPQAGSFGKGRYGGHELLYVYISQPPGVVPKPGSGLVHKIGHYRNNHVLQLCEFWYLLTKLATLIVA